MVITDIISITELSRLTKKSRPSIYKYINEYNDRNFDDIPFSFIKLLDMAYTNRSKAEIIAYCHTTYGTDATSSLDRETQELINLIVLNRNAIDINRVKKFILEELDHE